MTHHTKRRHHIEGALILFGIAFAGIAFVIGIISVD